MAMRGINTLGGQQHSGSVQGLSRFRSLLKLLSRAGQLFLTVVDIPFRYIFGRDLFISYSRRDSRRYAPNLALSLQKRMPKLSLYLDRWVAPPSGQLPLSLRMQLRWSSILVVICTENAVGSPFVQDEVARFAKLRRKVVTVDVAGAYNVVRGQQPWLEVNGADPEDESSEAVQRGEPSENVIERILKSVEFATQDRRLRRAVWGTIAFVTVSVGGTGTYSYFTIRDANAKAESAEARAMVADARVRAADEKAMTAEGKAQSAEQRETAAVAAAQTARDAAAEQTHIAGEQKVLAEQGRREAEKQKMAAEENERTAHHFLYSGHINGAQQAAEAENFIYAQSLLKRHQPEPGKEDLRGFEWHYLWRSSHRRWATLKEHTNEIRALAYSHDGRTLATTDADGVAILWDTATWKVKKRLTGHEGEATCVAFSADGSKLATGGEDGTVRIWVDGEEPLVFKGHHGKVNGVAFSPDSNRLASASDDLTVRLWDVRVRKEIAVLGGFSKKECDCEKSGVDFTVENEVRVVAFSPDGKMLAAGDSADDIKIWDTSTLEELNTITGSLFTEGTVSLAFTTDGTRIVTTRENGEIKIWETLNVGQPRIIKNNLGRLFERYNMKLKENSQEPMDNLAPSDIITSPMLAPDRKTLLTVTSGGDVVGRNLYRDKESKKYEWLSDRHQLSGKHQPSGDTVLISTLAVSPDGLVLVADRGANLEVWDMRGVPEFSAIEIGEAEPAQSVAFSPDGKTIAVGTLNIRDSIYTYDVATLREKNIIKGYDASEVAYSPDGKTLALWGQESSIRLVTADRGAIFRTLKGHTREVWTVAFTHDGGKLASGGPDNTVNLWDLSTYNERPTTIFRLSEDVDIRSLSFSKDDRLLAVGCGDGIVRLWDVVKSRELPPLGNEGAHLFQVRFSPDGKTLAASSFDGTIKLWNVGDWREVITLRGHAAAVQSLAFSRDSKTLASGSGDGIIKLWSIGTGLELTTFKWHKERSEMLKRSYVPVNSLAFSPDGSVLASGGHDGSVKLWFAAVASTRR